MSIQAICIYYLPSNFLAFDRRVCWGSDNLLISFDFKNKCAFRMYFKWRHVSSGRKDNSNIWTRISHPSQVKVSRLSTEMTFFVLQNAFFSLFVISSSAEAAALWYTEKAGTCFQLVSFFNSWPLHWRWSWFYISELYSGKNFSAMSPVKNTSSWLVLLHVFCCQEYQQFFYCHDLFFFHFKLANSLNALDG